MQFTSDKTQHIRLLPGIYCLFTLCDNIIKAPSDIFVCQAQTGSTHIWSLGRGGNSYSSSGWSGTAQARVRRYDGQTLVAHALRRACALQAGGSWIAS